MRNIRRNIAKAEARRAEDAAKAQRALDIQDRWASLTPNDRIKLMARSANLTVTDTLAMIARRKGK